MSSLDTPNFLDIYPHPINEQLSDLEKNLEQIHLPEIQSQVGLDKIFADTSEKLHVIVLGFQGCAACPPAKSSVQHALDLAEARKDHKGITGYEIDIRKHRELLQSIYQKSGKKESNGFPQVVMIRGGKLLYHEEGGASSNVILGHLKTTDSANPKPVPEKKNTSTPIDPKMKPPVSKQDSIPAKNLTPNNDFRKTVDTKKKPVPLKEAEKVYQSPAPSGFWDKVPQSPISDQNAVEMTPQEGPILDFPYPVVVQPESSPKQTPILDNPTSKPSKASKSPKEKTQRTTTPEQPKTRQKEVIEDAYLTLDNEALKQLAMPLLNKNPQVTIDKLRIIGTGSTINAFVDLQYDTQVSLVGKVKVNAMVGLENTNNHCKVTNQKITAPLGSGAIIEPLAKKEIDKLPQTLQSAIEQKYQIKAERLQIEGAKLKVFYKQKKVVTEYRK